MVTQATTLLSPAFVPLFTMKADLGASLDSGAEGPLGRRAANSLTGGTFEGPRLRGTLAYGADWMLTRRDGVNHIDARVALKTHDDAIIHMSYCGRAVVPPDLLPELRDMGKRHLVDPGRYYFRTTPLFETGAQEYAWLNDIVCVGLGRLLERGGVGYDVFALK